MNCYGCNHKTVPYLEAVFTAQVLHHQMQSILPCTRGGLYVDVTCVHHPHDRVPHIVFGSHQQWGEPVSISEYVHIHCSTAKEGGKHGTCIYMNNNVHRVPFSNIKRKKEVAKSKNSHLYKLINYTTISTCMHMKCNTPSCNLVAQYIKSAASATILHVTALWFEVTLQMCKLSSEVPPS